MKYSYVIIEDNLNAAKSLQLFMREHPDYEEKGMTNQAQKAVSLIVAQKPDLVFLDVELIGGTGFDIIHELKQYFRILPTIIMITSHDHYAKEALNNDAFYFISKPFDPDELDVALTKFEKKHQETQRFLNIKTSEGSFFIQGSDIILIMSDSNYAYIFKTNGDTIVLSKTIRDIEAKLPLEFIRIHKSYIVNQQFVEMINTSVKKLIVNYNQPLTYIAEKVYEKEKIDAEKINSMSKIWSAAYRNERKIVLPIGDSYIQSVKKALL